LPGTLDLIMSESSKTVGPGLTLIRALIIGGIGFTIVSVAGFGLWAFAGKWFYSHIGEVGLYAASTIVFLGLSGLLLHSLICGERKVIRFYKIFVPAFLLYAAAWCGCWFAWKFGAGEWLGSFLGCAVFSLVLAKAFNNWRALLYVIVILFLLHSAGYFAGDWTMKSLKPDLVPVLNSFSKQSIGTLAKLSWGVCYGAGFGLGIGYAFYAMQKSRSH
jgi:hypothetical protein